ncbi:hypothetical protein B0187_00010 [Haemophilus paracuniculus]|uniref:FRG domain-containing protein n=1 Tax=Haemophilus paracuniculus TaxID=734 RepID=A0A1T0AV20_9PAST|nr:FRG domain-containing protein [Haemophilus paracuniculus]OOS00722.1 hypothetical protein B0187_00010 [Haemophilus paracuniculus]
MCNEIRITNVAKFMEELSKLTSLESLTATRFFRGHSDQNYKLIPSVYREEDLIKNEDKIIKEAFTYCANDFLPHETLFEKLAKLQHYDYATRLLDVSANALVGLYFAVRDFKSTESSKAVDNSKDGEVIVLDIPNKSIKYDDSDTVTILSSLSLRNGDLNLEEIIKNIREQAELDAGVAVIDTFLKNKDMYISNEFPVDYIPELSAINEKPNDLLRKLYDAKLSESFKFHFNKSDEIGKLLHDIRKDKPYFLPIINADDFNQVLCVKAKPNSPRISRQHGAFLLFGINGNKATMATVPTEWINKPNGNRLIIDKDSKAKILQELAILGISSQTLFPELDKQAKPIMEKYRTPKSE